MAKCKCILLVCGIIVTLHNHHCSASLSYLAYILAYLHHKCMLSNLGICHTPDISGANLYLIHVLQYYGKLMLQFIDFLTGAWSIIGSLYRQQKKYLYSVAGIFVQGHMPVLWNACILVHLVILLIALRWYEVYTLIQVSHVHMNQLVYMV